MAYADLADFREALALDLDDVSHTIWATDELDRAIGWAVSEISGAVGQSATVDLATTAGVKDYDIKTLTDIQRLEGVEYPTGEELPSWVPFWVYEETLRLLIPEAPSTSNEAIRLYYTKVFTVDAEGSNLPEALEEVALLGARGRCLLQRAAGSIAEAGVELDVPGYYRELGLETMDDFQKRLAQLQAERYLPPYPAATPSWWGKPVGWDII